MATEEKAPPGVPTRYTGIAETPPPPPAPRDAAARITELLRPRAAPTRSREEQAFIDLQRGCHQ